MSLYGFLSLQLSALQVEILTIVLKRQQIDNKFGFIKFYVEESMCNLNANGPESYAKVSACKKVNAVYILSIKKIIVLLIEFWFEMYQKLKYNE